MHFMKFGSTMFHATNDIMQQNKNTKMLDKKITEDFYNSVEASIRMCQIVGCGPFSFSINGIRKTVKNYLLVVLQIIVFGGFLVYDFLMIGRKGHKTDPIDIVTKISPSTLFCVWIEGALKVESWSILLKKLIIVDKELLKFDVFIDYFKLMKKSRWILVGQLCFVNLPIIVSLYNGQIDLRVFLIYCLPHWSAVTISYTLAEMMNLINLRFQSLNQLLKSLINRNLDYISVLGRNKKQKTPLSILCHVCTWHHNLIKLIKLTNETFGFRMVAYFAGAFVVLVVDIFDLCQEFKRPPDWSRVFHLLTVISCYSYNVYKICNVCETTVLEAKKSGLYIHQIETEDFEMRDEIEMFSLQIANENIEFNAAGFFPVNHGLLFSIIGAVTTYIIILIQLESDTDSSTTTTMMSSTSTTP